jgi:hypothetical protein
VEGGEVSDEELQKQVRSLNVGLGLLWVVVLTAIALLVKAGAFDGLFK